MLKIKNKMTVDFHPPRNGYIWSQNTGLNGSHSNSTRLLEVFILNHDIRFKDIVAPNRSQVTGHGAPGTETNIILHTELCRLNQIHKQDSAVVSIYIIHRFMH